MTRADRHMIAAANLIWLALDDADFNYSSKCLRIADWHLWEASRLRRNAELNDAFDAKLTLELKALEAA